MLYFGGWCKVICGKNASGEGECWVAMQNMAYSFYQWLPNGMSNDDGK